VWDIIGTLIAGTIIGAIAQTLVPGRQRIPIWLTIAAGIAGVIVGNLIAGIFGVEDTRGIDWWRWILSIAAAAIAVVLAANWDARRRSSA
jgi:uncharacterized membrane protein YeaQ/YmgE (transglycosylase-associated protein family)